jgi:hypothetical protein
MRVQMRHEVPEIGYAAKLLYNAFAANPFCIAMFTLIADCMSFQ